MKKRMLVVISAMGLAAASTTCGGRVGIGPSQRSQLQGSELQGSETQGTNVLGTETSDTVPRARATGLRFESVRVVGGQLVFDKR